MTECNFLKTNSDTMRNFIWLALIMLITEACQFSDSPVEAIQDHPRFAKAEAQELFKHILPQPQTFELTVNTDTVIECKNGTIISLPRGCFVDINGRTVDGPIE